MNVHRGCRVVVEREREWQGRREELLKCKYESTICNPARRVKHVWRCRVDKRASNIRESAMTFVNGLGGKLISTNFFIANNSIQPHGTSTFYARFNVFDSKSLRFFAPKRTLINNLPTNFCLVNAIINIIFFFFFLYRTPWYRPPIVRSGRSRMNNYDAWLIVSRSRVIFDSSLLHTYFSFLDGDRSEHIGPYYTNPVEIKIPRRSASVFLRCQP